MEDIQIDDIVINYIQRANKIAKATLESSNFNEDFILKIAQMIQQEEYYLISTGHIITKKSNT